MKVLITGSNGMLGHDLIDVLNDKHELILTTSKTLDITDKEHFVASSNSEGTECRDRVGGIYIWYRNNYLKRIELEKMYYLLKQAVNMKRVKIKIHYLKLIMIM